MQVCKLYADQAAPDELVLGWPGYPKTNWYLTDRPIDYAMRISFKAFLTFNASQFRLRQLKFLCIDLPKYFDSEFLNDFKQLVHLQISRDSLSEVGGRNLLALPNLRVLSVVLNFRSLKTPKLEVLYHRDVQRIELEHPESVKKMESHSLDAFKIAKFKNLEVFRSNHYAGYRLDRDLLSAWKHLKELDISLVIENFESAQYEPIRNSLVHMLAERAITKRNELNIYLNDVLLLDASQLLDYYSMKSNNTSDFYFKNYKLIRTRRAGRPARRSSSCLVGLF